MSKTNKKLAYELYVQDLQKAFDTIGHYVQFFNFYENEKAMVEQSMILFNNLLEEMKDVESLDEAKKYVKLKKLVEKYNLED